MKGIARLLDVSSFSSTKASLLIVAVSLAVKLAYIALLGGGFWSLPQEGSDVYFYENAARNILSSGIFGVNSGLSTVGMPPGEPAFLALLYKVSNNSILFAKLAHVALLTAVAVLTFFTGKGMSSQVIGFWGGILIAVDPAQAYLAGTFLSEPLFIFLMVLGIFLLSMDDSSARWERLAGAGICFGIAGLTRNQGWLFAAALWLGAMTTFGRLISRRRATLVLLVCFAVIAPWTYRNYLVTGEFVPVASEGGLNLWASNNPDFVFRPPMPMSLEVYTAPKGLSEVAVDRFYRQRAIDWIVAHPLDFLANGLRKVFMLFNFDPASWRPDVSNFYRLVGLVPYGFLLPFILLGMLLNLANPKYRIILTYIFFTAAMAFCFYGDSRIRAPIQPYLYIFGALGAQVAFLALKPRIRSLQIHPGKGTEFP